VNVEVNKLAEIAHDAEPSQELQTSNEQRGGRRIQKNHKTASQAVVIKAVKTTSYSHFKG
jgi:hypothetical protein